MTASLRGQPTRPAYASAAGQTVLPPQEEVRTTGKNYPAPLQDTVSAWMVLHDAFRMYGWEFVGHMPRGHCAGLHARVSSGGGGRRAQRTRVRVGGVYSTRPDEAKAMDGSVLYSSRRLRTASVVSFEFAIRILYRSHVCFVRSRRSGGRRSEAAEGEEG